MGAKPEGGQCREQQEQYDFLVWHRFSASGQQQWKREFLFYKKMVQSVFIVLTMRHCRAVQQGVKISANSGKIGGKDATDRNVSGGEQGRHQKMMPPKSRAIRPEAGQRP
jgi:hypothetical protein